MLSLTWAHVEADVNKMTGVVQQLAVVMLCHVFCHHRLSVCRLSMVVCKLTLASSNKNVFCCLATPLAAPGLTNTCLSLVTVVPLGACLKLLGLPWWGCKQFSRFKTSSVNPSHYQIIWAEHWYQPSRESGRSLPKTPVVWVSFTFTMYNEHQRAEPKIVLHWTCFTVWQVDDLTIHLD